MNKTEAEEILSEFYHVADHLFIPDGRPYELRFEQYNEVRERILNLLLAVPERQNNVCE